MEQRPRFLVLQSVYRQTEPAIGTNQVKRILVCPAFPDILRQLAISSNHCAFTHIRDQRAD